MTQAGVVVTFGMEDRSYNCEEERGASGIQILFHFLMWDGIYKTCKLYGNSLNSTLLMCKLKCVHLTL